MSDAPFTPAELITHTGHAIHKVDTSGPRGVSYVTWVEIEAMCVTLALLGIPSLPPSETVEDGAPDLDPRVPIPADVLARLERHADRHEIALAAFVRELLDTLSQSGDTRLFEILLNPANANPPAPEGEDT
ncbi:hypothetical protein [Roseivivax halotolerans]|nr:hypothetical protein [Roseivivax halotolerans]